MIRSLILLTTLFFSTAGSAEAEKPTVLVSIAPYEWFVRQIAGKSVDVEVLVPPGASLHSYEPRLKQALPAGHAKLWFRLGAPAELAALEALQNSSMKLVDLREGLPLIGHGSSFDPHI